MDKYLEHLASIAGSLKRIADSLERPVMSGPPVVFPTLPRKKVAAKVKAEPGVTTPGMKVWGAYCQAFRERYPKTPEGLPARNATAAAQAKRLVDMVGLENALKAVLIYLKHQDPYYQRQRHPFGVLLKDVQRILTDEYEGPVDAPRPAWVKEKEDREATAGWRVTATEAEATRKHLDEIAKTPRPTAEALKRVREQVRKVTGK